MQQVKAEVQAEMLEAIDIHKTYIDGPRRLEVLKGVSLTIEPGAFVALVGPSGAGKSTLLHILGGLDAPSSGSVRFQDRQLYRLKEQDLARVRNTQIGFVFQFYHLLSELTVIENVMMPALIAAGGRERKKQAQRKAEQLLAETGLADRMAHFPAQLSGGEQQRAALVRALMNEPRLLLCDEPTGNLDSETSDEIIALVRRIHSRTRMTTLLVTHNAELAKSAQRQYFLKDGRLLQ